MDRSKKIRKQTKNIHKKNFYIFIVIFIMFSCVFPPMRNAETPTFETHLSIVNITVTPDPVTEMNTVHLYITIQNIGSHNISAGEQIVISVKVDNEPSIIASLTDSLGLLKTQLRTENLTWVAVLGSSQSRLLQVTITYAGILQAMVEREIQVNERKTDLLFVPPRLLAE